MGRQSGQRAKVTRRSSDGAFSAKGFAPLWFSGLAWHWSRWAIAFLAGYHVNALTDSPRMVQLTGAVMWAPLLLGGAIGGVISDRFDRRRTVRTQMALLTPCVALVGLAETQSSLGIWLLYAFLLFAGIGWVVDMTSRRALVLDIVGTQRLHKAMAWETMALSSGVTAGNLLGGTIADQFGVGAGFLGVAAMMCFALVMLLFVPRAAPPTSDTNNATDAGNVANASRPAKPATQNSAVAELRIGLRLARSNRGLLSILGVTVMANFFMFAYFPAVQRIGTRLDASPSQIGLIASMTGFGMITGSLVTARWGRGRWGIAYVSGVFLAMSMLIVWANSPNVAFAVVSLYLASCGSGLFAATQSTLVLTIVPEQMRGRAMGLLSMAIGALPIGTYVLGEVAEALGARVAVMAQAGAGIVCLAAWLMRHPEVVRRTGPE